MSLRASGKNLLRVEKVTIRFGGLTALDGVDLEVRQGEIHGLIGPNGSGKTTLFNVISGLYRQESGHVYFSDQLLDGVEPYRRAQMGINRSFQHQRTFKGLTVLENVLMGQHKTLLYGSLGAVFNRKKARQEEEKAIERALQSLDFVNLRGLADRPIHDLAYVEQRLVEIARALASDQALMLLDEPAAGLSSTTITEMDALLVKIRQERKISIFIIEHVLSLIFNLSDTITVLNEGKKIAEGRPGEIQNNDSVQEAYIGKADLWE